MVSLFNNEGMRLRYTQNETMIQFPNYLYDPYAYPSNLSLMDYHWNLFYPQNHYAIQTKRKKKLKEQLANERIFKEMMPSFEYKKSELIEWLKSLTVTERFKVFSIQDNWLTAALIKMYKKWADCDDIVFALLSDSKKSGDNKSSLQFDDLENYFFCRRKPSIEAPPLEKQALIENGEKEIIENLRIYDSNEVYDTIMLDERFVEDIDNIVKLFELISEGFAFSKPCKLAYDHSTKTVVWDSPLWFSSNSFQTFPAWIVSSLERAVWVQYFNEKKSVVRNSMLASGLETQISLKYKDDLTDFWKTLDKNKKKKMFASAVETYKSMSSEKSKTDSKDSKDISQKLKLLFSTIYGSNKSDLPSNEKVSEYFQGLSVESEDELAIKKILFTPLDDFGSVTNLICRKLTHKLKTMLSEKIATDLIMNEEKEKSNNNKKNTKKRKLAKGASKNIPSLIHNTSDEPELRDTVKSEEKHEDDLKHCLIPLKDDIKNSSSTEDKVDNTELDPTVGGSSLEIIPSCSSVNCEIWEYAKSIVNKIVARTILGSPMNDAIGHHEFDTCKGRQCQNKTLDDANFDRKLSLEAQIGSSNEEGRVKLSPIQKKQQAKDDRSAGKRLKNIVEVNVSHKDRTPENLKNYEEEKHQTDSSVCSTIETKNSASEEGEVQERVQQPKFVAKTEDNKRVKEEPRYLERGNETRKNLKKEFDNEGGFRRTKQNDSQKYNSNYRTEIDTTDSESGLLLKGKGSSAQQEKFYSETQRVNRVSNESSGKDSFGFIEVKPKKKKSVKPIRTKKEPKEGFRKKKEKTSTATPAAESQQAEKVKGPAVNRSTVKATPNNEIKKPAEETKKPVAPIQIPAAAAATTTQTQTKVTTPKAAAQNKPALVVSCGPQVLTKQSSTGSGPESATGVQSTVAPKVASGGRKMLSLTSPSLDFGAIQTNRVKGIAKEYFEKKFTKDIFDHVSVMTEKSNKMMQSRILVYKRLDLCIAKIFPMYNMKTKIFGSCATGLALTTSDVDIAVSGIDTYDRGTLCDSLLQISEGLKSFKWLVSFKPILTAHVPVLKLEIDPRINFEEIVDANAANDMKVKTILNCQTPDLNLPCDLDEDVKIKVDLTLESLGMMGYSIHMGYKSTEFAEKMLEKYDSLYIVTMALKEFLFNRKLLNTYQGGVSSYCLIIMIVTIMKKYGDEGYMASLKRFFKVYGESFQPENTGISLGEADPFFPLNHSYETAPLWIIDHNNFVERRNIGQGAYLVKGILHEFEKASKILDFLQQKFEETVLQHKSKVKTVEDIELIEDPELKNFMNTSLLESFMPSI